MVKLTDNIMKGLERNMRYAQLLAFVRKMRTGKNEVDELGAGKVGDAVSNQYAEILLFGKPPNDRRFAHAAAVIAVLVAGMRPGDRHVVTGKVASVAIDMIGGNAERLEYRVNEEIYPSARDVEWNMMYLAPFKQLGKAGTNVRVVHNVGLHFILHRRREEGEHLSNALLDRFTLTNNVANDKLPSRRIEVLHGGYDIIVECYRSIEIAEQNGWTREMG